MATEQSGPIIPLNECFEHIKTIQGATLANTKVVSKILQQIISSAGSEDSGRFRDLNGVKVLTRIIPERDLALWYVLMHAGFRKQNDRLICGPEVQLDQIQSVLSKLQASIPEAAI